MTTSRTFRLAYAHPGKCANCARTFSVGQWIRLSKTMTTEGYVFTAEHVECERVAPVQRVAPNILDTIAEGGIA